MKRILRSILLVILLASSAKNIFAEVSGDVREKITQQAASLSVSASPMLQEGLRITGFLDDPKTNLIAGRAPPAYALAWAALQAENESEGSGVQLLQTVAQSIAAHHNDAIRREVAFATYFSQFPENQPVPPPSRSKFTFDRSIPPAGDMASRLPLAARQLLRPLSYYADLHPGGLYGLMVDSLGLRGTDAMNIEQSSPDVASALITGVERAPIPPSQAQHLEDLLVALLMHAGEPIRYDAAVARFGKERVDPAEGPGQTHSPLVEAQEAPVRSSTANVDQERTAAVKLAQRILNSLPPDDLNPTPTPIPPPPPKESFSSNPAFERTARQLHADGVSPSLSMPAMAEMRGLGGGRGGGGIVMGSSVTSTISGKPIFMSLRPIERSARMVPIVAMNDGSVMYGVPVRADVALAAYRIGFGNKLRNIPPLPATDSQGVLLVSLLARFGHPVVVSQFLVNPAISDTNLGRDLIVCDGANFIFSDQLDGRLNGVKSTPAAPNAATLTTAQWRDEVRQKKFGSWYRFSDRPTVISLTGDIISVNARSGMNQNILFEFIRPAEKANTFSPSGPQVAIPERSIIISDVLERISELKTFNDLLRTTAIARWAATNGAHWISGGLKYQPLRDVRSVVSDRNSASFTFDSRYITEIELDETSRRMAEATSSIPPGKQAQANKLIDALQQRQKEDMVRLEAKSRGYSSDIVDKVAVAYVREAATSHALISNVVMEIIQPHMSADEFSKFREFENNCKATTRQDFGRREDALREILCDMAIRQRLMEFEPWAEKLIDAF